MVSSTNASFCWIFCMECSIFIVCWSCASLSIFIVVLVFFDHMTTTLTAGWGRTIPKCLPEAVNHSSAHHCLPQGVYVCGGGVRVCLPVSLRTCQRIHWCVHAWHLVHFVGVIVHIWYLLQVCISEWLACKSSCTHIHVPEPTELVWLAWFPPTPIGREGSGQSEWCPRSWDHQDSLKACFLYCHAFHASTSKRGTLWWCVWSLCMVHYRTTIETDTACVFLLLKHMYLPDTSSSLLLVVVV